MKKAVSSINLYNSGRPTPQSLAWIENSTGQKIDTDQIKSLPGGASSLVFEIPFTAESGQEALILRLFHNKEWLQQEPDLVRHESESLKRAAFSKIATPEFIDGDESGEFCGMPAVLMSKLPGEPLLNAADLDSWLDGMAQQLAGIHAVETTGFNFEYYSYNDALKLEKQLWSKLPAEWMRAFFVVAGVRPSAPLRFIHRDYHPANILWEENRITGVVDWVNACVGPAGVDVGHCRVNLAQSHGIAAADEFLECYMRHAGPAFAYDPYWDLVSLTDILDGPPKVYSGWTALGMSGLSDELIRHRLDQYLLTLLERFDE